MGGRSRPELFGSRGEGCSLRVGTVDAGPEVDRQHHPGSGQSIAVLLLGSSPLRAEGEPTRPRRPRAPSSGYLHTRRYHWHLISFAAGRSVSGRRLRQGLRQRPASTVFGTVILVVGPPRAASLVSADGGVDESRAFLHVLLAGGACHVPSP